MTAITTSVFNNFLMGKKTFKRNELDIIKGVGFNIQVEPDVL